ncbi:DUF58 domain-containing protein [Roseateles sp. BYS180W]|uniref:DUF58 domain-containing protein n=1 Tax=Roseateles rivi TaxID=3299028 RepID=A0ABW7FYD0_9BURK
MQERLTQRWRQWWLQRRQRFDTHALTQRSLYILPSRAGLMFALTLALMLVAAINDQVSLGYLLAFLLAGAGLASMYSTHANLHGLQLDLRPPQPTHQGDPLLLEVRLHNPGQARWGIGLRPQGAKDLSVQDVPAQGHALVHLQLGDLPRGRHAVPTLHIESRFPLGLFRVWSVWRPASTLWVYPAPEAEAPALPDGHGGMDDAGRAGPSSGDPDGLRPYRLGDAPRRIDWKKSAPALQRPQRPGSTPQLWVHDSQALGGRTVTLRWQDTQGLAQEARIARLAAWVQAAHSQQRPYALELPQQCLQAQHSQAHRDACLQALALLPGAEGTHTKGRA